MITIARIIISSLMLFCSVRAMELDIKVVQGAESACHLPMHSALSIETFKQFPYLYVGSNDLENDYYGQYPENPDTLFTLAYVPDDSTEWAGILIGTPLLAVYTKGEAMQNMCKQAGIIVEDYYYIGEVITRKQFRNRGIATNLFNIMEQNIKQLGYKHACFITVERELDHPLRPKDYKSPASLFQKLGYVKTEQRALYNWPTIQSDGSIKDFDNIVALWIKEL